MRRIVHADNCGAELDSDGMCPRCRFHPDMQSTAFVRPRDPVEAILAVECPQCFSSPGTACYDFLARDPAHHSSRIRRALGWEP